MREARPVFMLYTNKKRENIFTMSSRYQVGVTGFEPTASWSRTKRIYIFFIVHLSAICRFIAYCFAVVMVSCCIVSHQKLTLLTLLLTLFSFLMPVQTRDFQSLFAGFQRPRPRKISMWLRRPRDQETVVQL